MVTERIVQTKDQNYDQGIFNIFFPSRDNCGDAVMFWSALLCYGGVPVYKLCNGMRVTFYVGTGELRRSLV
mgnify:CR=1 FL=1